MNNFGTSPASTWSAWATANSPISFSSTRTFPESIFRHSLRKHSLILSYYHIIHAADSLKTILRKPTGFRKNGHSISRPQNTPINNFKNIKTPRISISRELYLLLFSVIYLYYSPHDDNRASAPPGTSDERATEKPSCCSSASSRHLQHQ